MNDTTSLNQLFGMKSDQRYDAFLESVFVSKQVWLLRDEEGCLMVVSGDEECIPVWPSSEAAEACAIADWKGFEPMSVSLEDWLTKWLPGMDRDGRAAAVCPNLAGESLVVSAPELLAELQD